MEDINKVTQEQLTQLRGGFFDKVKANNPGFHPDDLERVKTDELWLRRFIAHGEQDVETATNLLYECCQWRKEFGVNELDHTKMDAALFEKGTLFIRNKDKFGKKLLIFKAKHHQKGTVDMDQLQKFIVYYFERIERETRSDQISIIFDMKDTGWQNMDMDFVRYLITLLKTYYPYFVNYLMIFEMPWLLNAAWKIIKGWLPPKFVDRVKFVDKKTIKDWIEPDNQLADWGGSDNYVYKFEPEVRQKRTMANGRGPPDPKPRKAKISVEPTAGTPDRTSRLVDHDGIYDNGSPSTSHSSSPVRAAFQQGGNQAFVTLEHCLAEVDERITFKPTENDEYSCRLHIQNIAQGSNSIVFKIKTTSPDRYRVRPTIAVIEPGATAKVPITTYPGISASQIGRDRFQVQVCILPKDMVNDESCESMNSSNQSLHNSNIADLTSVFKKLINSPGTAIDTFKVAVSVEARAGDTAVAGPTVSMNEERMRKGLDDLEKKITESVYNKVQPKVDRMMWMMYAIVAVLVVILAMLWRLNSATSLVVDCGTACPDFVPKAECSSNYN